MFLTHTTFFFPIKWLFTIQSIHSSFMPILKYKNLKFKYVIDEIYIDLIILNFCKFGR